MQSSDPSILPYPHHPHPCPSSQDALIRDLRQPLRLVVAAPSHRSRRTGGGEKERQEGRKQGGRETQTDTGTQRKRGREKAENRKQGMDREGKALPEPARRRGHSSAGAGPGWPGYL